MTIKTILLILTNVTLHYQYLHKYFLLNYRGSGYSMEFGTVILGDGEAATANSIVIVSNGYCIE